ncbi:hypothetical protein SAMN04488244_10567 [Vibrio hangzhouensis]|uniref:Uncharacterized protein n=1 Tax=Vibrio hangzhouensis TaxID=462991 RepID=A0A1H5VYX4_9VIBR|nr:hypothetical protein SAMN04488244_10567 [Vibrio hangzhouensis]
MSLGTIYVNKPKIRINHNLLSLSFFDWSSGLTELQILYSDSHASHLLIFSPFHLSTLFIGQTVVHKPLYAVVRRKTCLLNVTYIKETHTITW